MFKIWLFYHGQNMSSYNVSIEAWKLNSFSFFPNRPKANTAQRNLDCILCFALTPSGMFCHLLWEGLVLYLFWDRRTRRVLYSPGNDHLENLDGLHRGTPRWDRNGSRHWCRDVLPSCDHRSGSYKLQGKKSTRENVGFRLFAHSQGARREGTLLLH